MLITLRSIFDYTVCSVVHEHVHIFVNDELNVSVFECLHSKIHSKIHSFSSLTISDILVATVLFNYWQPK